MVQIPIPPPVSPSLHQLPTNHPSLPLVGTNNFTSYCYYTTANIIIKAQINKSPFGKNYFISQGSPLFPTSELLLPKCCFLAKQVVLEWCMWVRFRYCPACRATSVSLISNNCPNVANPVANKTECGLEKARSSDR